MPLPIDGNALPALSRRTRPADMVEQPAAATSRRDVSIATLSPSSKKIDKHSLDYALRSGLAGGLAGCAAKTVVGPLDRVKILFQASNPTFAKYSGSWTGLYAAMRDINQQDGLRGLFRGHSATLLRVFPYAGIRFLAYEQIRAVLIRSPAQETPLRRLLSGSLAGITSVFFTYPLELVRVRLAFETRRDSRAGLARIFDQIYHERPPTRTAGAAPRSPRAASGATTAAAAAAAAEGSARAVTPRSGLVNFYRGFSPTLVGMVPYAGMGFLTHDAVGDLLRHPRLAPYTTKTSPLVTTPASPETRVDDDRHNQQQQQQQWRPRLKTFPQLASGAVAGVVSQTASYPLEVIRRRMQVGGAVGDGKRLGMGETARLVWAERGLRGFFVGLGIGYLKVVPMTAVSFWVYEESKIVLGI